MGKSKSWQNRIIEQAIMPVAELAENPRNWRTHPDRQADALSGALESVGVVQGVIFNKRTGLLVDGHLRVELARKSGVESLPVTVVDLSPEEEALVLATLDPIGAMAAADSEKLEELLSELRVEDERLQELICCNNGTTVNTRPEDMNVSQELIDKWGVENNQLWMLGEHLLLCGDSTDGELAKSIGGHAETLFFDPEWDSDHVIDTEMYESILVFSDGKRGGEALERFGPPSWIFAWDCCTSWYTPNRPLKRGKLCFWYGDINSYDFNGSHYGLPGEEGTVSNSRGSYKYMPDERGKHLSDVFKFPITQMRGLTNHNHSKPLDWVRMLIGNCTKGDVFDPFAGAGTALIACEQLGRKSVCVEVSRLNVGIILQRWADLTGGSPTLVPQ